jgi:very-short-patch-repair endonuclease/predicted transcriptional regulator of viral defense system
MPTASPGESRLAAVIPPQLGAHHPTDRELHRAARERHGVLTVTELERLGLSGRAVRDRAASGRLHRVHRGVYAIGPPSAAGHCSAALLACGPAAVLSHGSAAALWDLSPDPARAHVNVPGRARSTRQGLIVHGARLDPSEVTTRDGLPCTTVARTLLDLATTVPRRRLERAIDRAEELRVFDLRELQAVVDRRRGERGTAILAAVLAEYDGPEATRYAAEARLLAIVERSRLPQPEVNAWLPLPEGGGYRPDFLWRDRRLVVEVDGRTHHARRRAFEHDRRRDRRLALAGYETRRYSAREVLRQPDRVTTELRAFLASHG